MASGQLAGDCGLEQRTVHADPGFTPGFRTRVSEKMYLTLFR